MIVLKINNRDFEAVKECKAEEYTKNVWCCDMNMDMPNMMSEAMPGVVCPPVYECPQESVCHRYICHEVPHIIPCNTRIINHHIYRHTYMPAYSCCEENEVQNVYERRCC